MDYYESMKVSMHDFSSSVDRNDVDFGKSWCDKNWIISKTVEETPLMQGKAGA